MKRKQIAKYVSRLSMIIGFMGKGGSGKTSLSTAFTRFLLQKKYQVLAIDADHNMDLLFNLAGEQEVFPYLGNDHARIKALLGMPQEYTTYQQAIAEERINEQVFGTDNAFFTAFTREVSPNLWCMAAGPHTEDIHHGVACSHTLSSSLKAYLPFLALRDEQMVVVDSTAGMDMVGTGIARGMDMVCIVTEPTIHATKTAKQIAQGLAEHGVPSVYLVNKCASEEQYTQAVDWLGQEPLAVCRFAADLATQEAALQNIFTYAQELVATLGGNARRRERAVRLAKEGRAFASAR